MRVKGMAVSTLTPLRRLGVGGISGHNRQIHRSGDVQRIVVRGRQRREVRGGAAATALSPSSRSLRMSITRS